MMSVSPRQVRHALEEAFFRDVDEMIVRRLRSEAESGGARETLIKTTGLTDKTLIDELTQLGVTPEGLIAMRLVPLVMVAWAQGGVDEAERETVLKESRRFGVVDGSVAAVLLEHWLNRKPPLAILDAWKRYMNSECSKMSKAAKEKMIELMEQQMAAVAKASGGHFGVGKVAANEQQIIDMMTHVLRK